MTMSPIETSISAMGWNEILIVLAGGCIGALVKDCVEDGAISLPFRKDKKLYLGSVGAMFIGGFVGMVIDGTFVTALISGYTGASLISSLVTPKLRSGDSIVTDTTQTTTVSKQSKI